MIPSVTVSITISSQFHNLLPRFRAIREPINAVHGQVGSCFSRGTEAEAARVDTGMMRMVVSGQIEWLSSDSTELRRSVSHQSQHRFGANAGAPAEHCVINFLGTNHM